MFFFAPVIPDLIFSVLAVYVLAAVLPAILLMRYVYRQDQIEPEPVGLLASLVWKGVLAALAAIVLESLGQMVLECGHHLLEVEGEVVVFVGEVLVECSPADGGPVAQLAYGQLLKTFFLQQLCEGGVQGLIGFLQAQINLFLHKKAS